MDSIESVEHFNSSEWEISFSWRDGDKFRGWITFEDGPCRRDGIWTPRWVKSWLLSRKKIHWTNVQNWERRGLTLGTVRKPLYLKQSVRDLKIVTNASPPALTPHSVTLQQPHKQEWSLFFHLSNMAVLVSCSQNTAELTLLFQTQVSKGLACFQCHSRDPAAVMWASPS